MSASIAVLIVNFNAGPALGQCLASLGEHLGGFDWEALVVDNGSADGSDVAAEQAGPRVRVIRGGGNVGFAAAVNAAARLTRAPLLLLLNPDARLLPGAAEALCADLQAHAECAIVGPAVVNEDSSPQGSARGDPDMLTGIFGRTALATRLFPRLGAARRNVVVLEDAAGGRDVDWVSGACMLVRREAFDRVGGFDERFFLYWEDADLCRRLRNAGWRTRYQPAAKVVHLVGCSSRTNASLAIRAFHRSAYLYYATHVHPSAWHPARWAAFALLALRCRWRLIRRQRPGG
jgi:N-acetylglucosaminyl-diphospho-decaprenol L-rhamnosyltransferase